MKTLKELASSKKFLSLVVGVVVFILSRFGIGVGEEQLLPLVGLIASFIVGQGIADNGKEATKLGIAAAKDGLSTPLKDA